MTSKHLRYYILDAEGQPVQCLDLAAWVQWQETHGFPYLVAHTLFFGGITVSTVFLGLDYNSFFFGGAAPILYSTMIFGGGHEQRQWHYATRKEALEGHSRACWSVSRGAAERVESIEMKNELSK